MRKREPDSKASKKRPRPRAVVQALLGIGLDGKDGHVRITKGQNVILFGGSKETHEKMQEFAIRLDERMKAKGKAFGFVSPKELRDLAGDL